MRKIDFSDTTCQEVMGISADGSKLIECGRTGSTVIWHQRDGKHVYVMCDLCAYHSLKNRRAIELIQKPETPEPLKAAKIVA